MKGWQIALGSEKCQLIFPQVHRRPQIRKQKTRQLDLLTSFIDTLLLLLPSPTNGGVPEWQTLKLKWKVRAIITVSHFICEWTVRQPLLERSHTQIWMIQRIELHCGSLGLIISCVRPAVASSHLSWVSIWKWFSRFSLGLIDPVWHRQEPIGSS